MKILNVLNEGGGSTGGLGYASRTLREVKMKDGTVIQKDTNVVCEFLENSNTIFLVHFDGKEFRVAYAKASGLLNGFKPEPSTNALEKMSSAGVATTPLGKRTELDGYGEYGEPSWFLVLGLV
jgi:hypothetical protein